LAVFYQENPTLFTSSTLMHEDLRSPEALVAADLDADGDLDLASVNFGGQNITVFFQDSPRVFAPDPVAFGDGPELDEPHALASADVDGDGDLDLASAETGTGKLAVFFQYAPTRFDVGPLVLDVLSSAEDPCFIVAADIDMDGEIDLFSTHDSRDSLTILWGGR
jgi:hypothetical protein